MKVICQKCSATYAINDAAIPPKGARAQCPRCKHLQAVKRDEVAAPPPAPAPSDDPFASLDMAPAPPPPAPPPARAAPAAGGNDPFSDFEMPTAASVGARAPPPAARAAPPPANTSAPVKRPASDPFARLDLVAPKAPAAPPRPAPAADPFADLDFGSGSAAPTAPAAEPEPAAPAGPVVLGKCSVCGKPLTDPFDAALGTCESCRAKETPLSVPGAAAPKTGAAPAPVALASTPENRSAASTGSRPLVRDAQRRGGAARRHSSPAWWCWSSLLPEWVSGR
jgi:predicted Zn finger-like uncharacterized protein